MGIQLENRQDAIALLNLLIRRELTNQNDTQAVLEKLREALEHYKI